MRASITCVTEEELTGVVKAMTSGATAGVEVIKLTNHFLHPTPAGFQAVFFNGRWRF